jgi:hypothetical protein
MDPIPGADSLAKWRHLGVTEKNLVYSCSNFVVFLDCELDVDWESDPSYDIATLNSIFQNPLWGKIDGERAELEAIEMAHLRQSQKVGFRRQIGTGMCLALSGQLEGALKAMASARAYIGKCNREISRTWILLSASLATLVTTVLLAVGFIFISSVSRQELIVAAIAGTLGSWVSISSRLSSLAVEPGDGWLLHLSETGRRIVLGAVAGPLVLLGARQGLVLTYFAHAGFAGAALVGVASGILERLLPEMAGKLADDSQPRTLDE